ncbi:MAG: hypothetical protein IT191_04175 [Microbacteriaceae bacterium]|nr:hypothetical protein [Cryobacterium sp.]MBX3103657.1 hypothetical protein [Cryobacterium sp.]MCC6376197.1 hypothetical protein [Microbacteriaceae bacterium]
MIEPDLSASACLQILLEDQARRLRQIAQDLNFTTRRRLLDLPPEYWRGPARNAFNELRQQLTDKVSSAVSTLEEASTQSLKAKHTLEGHV